MLVFFVIFVVSFFGGGGVGFGVGVGVQVLVVVDFLCFLLLFCCYRKDRVYHPDQNILVMSSEGSAKMSTDVRII